MMTSTTPDCSVCCEKMNNSNRKAVHCPFCDFCTCRSCTQQYLTSVTSDPHCMNCKNVWNREFIDASCTKTFRNKELKTHRENILFEREKCLLPDTQPAVQRIREIQATERLLKDARAELERQKQHIWDLEHQIDVIRNGGTAEAAKERREFVRKCPIDECRGFLSSQWKCGTCEKKVCKDCNEELKDDEHECDPGAVETVKLLKKDTKPCPKCGTMIFKISGCSQMWCPDCHAVFNWNTMRIETGIIHNPHYYEFQRRNNNGDNRPAGRNLGDIPCGGMPRYHELHIRLSRIPDVHYLALVHRAIVHIQDWELRRNRVRAPNNEDLRVKYLMNTVSEEELKRLLQKREKDRSHRQDIEYVYQMLADTGADFMRQVVLDPTESTRVCMEFEELRTYANEQFEKIGIRYNRVCLYLDARWDISTRKWKSKKS